MFRALHYINSIERPFKMEDKKFYLNFINKVENEGEKNRFLILLNYKS